MPGVIAAFVAPAGEPMLGVLLAGFVILVVGLAVLSLVRKPHPLQSATATTRALLYALTYGLSVACFTQVIGDALNGPERSPWLLALGDVLFVTVALFTWVMALVEGHSFQDYGLKSIAAGRFVLTTLMGLGAVALFAFEPYAALLGGKVPLSADTVVFALLGSTLGSAIPEELLFRGYLANSLTGRTRLWARVALPALAFTAVRSLHHAPSLELGSQPWLFYNLGVVLPLGLWWGLMRELAGGAIWPCLASHALLEYGTTLAGATPGRP